MNWIICLNVLFAFNLLQIESKFLKAPIKGKNIHFTPTETVANDMCKRSPTGTLIPSSNCFEFFFCLNKIAVRSECRYGTYFDSILLKCVEGNDCRYRPPPTETPKCKQDEVKRVDNDCKSFQICKNGRFLRSSCPKGTYFSSTYLICRSITIDPDFQCSCANSKDLVIHNTEDCASFYTCEQGKPTLNLCPSEHYYNKYINSCLPDLENDCNNIEIEEEEEAEVDIEEEEKPNLCSDPFDVFLPNAFDCRKYYICVNGQAISKTCADNFYYDDKVKACVYDPRHACFWSNEQHKLVGGLTNNGPMSFEMLGEVHVETP